MVCGGCDGCDRCGAGSSKSLWSAINLWVCEKEISVVGVIGVVLGVLKTIGAEYTCGSTEKEKSVVGVMLGVVMGHTGASHRIILMSSNFDLSLSARLFLGVSGLKIFTSGSRGRLVGKGLAGGILLG